MTLSHHERIQAFLDAFPNMIAVGGQMAYDRDYRGPGWPYKFYSLNRHDLKVLLAERERLVEALGAALERTPAWVASTVIEHLARPFEGQVVCKCGRAWWDAIPDGHGETDCTSVENENEVEDPA